MREPLEPSYMTGWKYNCEIEGCDNKSEVFYIEKSIYLCFIHAEDVYT